MFRAHRLAAAIAAVLLGLVMSGAAVAAPAMWRVSDGRSQIYLFGTLHALDPHTRWRTPLYDQVMARAGTIWFETDLAAADPAAVIALVRRYGVDPATPLSDKLSPSDLAALSQETDVARIQHLRPWAAALMLSMQPALARGASVEAGADMAATRTARADAKRVCAFETLDDQARIFADLPEPSQVRYLSEVIHDRRPKLRLSFLRRPASLESAWMAGDLARLGPELVGGLKSDNPALYDALLRRRNLAWADRLAAEMADRPGLELVNVGALHMVGRDGLPALLAARGYDVERVQ